MQYYWKVFGEFELIVVIQLTRRNVRHSSVRVGRYVILSDCAGRARRHPQRPVWLRAAHHRLVRIIRFRTDCGVDRSREASGDRVLFNVLRHGRLANRACTGKQCAWAEGASRSTYPMGRGWRAGAVRLNRVLLLSSV